MKVFKKKVFIFFLFLMTSFLLVTPASAKTSTEFDNGLLIENRTYLPLRSIFEALDIKVGWEQITQTITATKESFNIELEIDMNFAKVNGEYIAIDVAPKLINSSTYVPVRFISETLGLEVKWNQESKTVTIETPDQIITIIVEEWKEPVKQTVSSNALKLSINDLVIDDFKPNADINQVVASFKKKYPNIPIDPFDYDGETSYLSGDPTPSMAYFLSFGYEDKKLTSYTYEQFDLDHKGLNVKTKKGIKAGSPIKDVYASYGKNAKEEITKNPKSNYLDLIYDVTIKETGQKGTLHFSARFGKGAKQDTAVVYGITYILESEAQAVKPPDYGFDEPILADVKKYFNKPLWVNYSGIGNRFEKIVFTGVDNIVTKEVLSGYTYKVVTLTVKRANGQEQDVTYNLDVIPSLFTEVNFFFENPFETYPWSEKTWNAIKNREVLIGMTKEQVKMSLGTPWDVNTSTTSYSSMEFWYYSGFFNTTMITFINGEVTQFQTY